ncbi:MAG: Lactobacillus phage Nyseid, partial [Cyanobacteriota bacterium]
MRVLSLFDGISTGQLALKHSQIKIDKYFACEIDPYAIKITQHNFPRTKQLGNVYDLNESNLPEDIDLLLAGFPCFVADTQVISSKGYVPIQDITVEDLVLTHTGNYEKVLQTNCRLSPTVILKAEGFAATETTLEHPYWTRLRTKTFVNKKPVYTFSEPYWEEVKNLTKNHFIALPILQKEENPRNLSHEDCWLLGRFIADGHIDNKPRKDRANSFNYKIILSIGSDKLVDFQRHVKRKYSQHAHGKSTHRIIFCSKLMVELYQDLGLVNGAINKIIPLELLNLPKHLLQSVIEGYMSGDGCYWGGRFSASSISLKLIQTLSLAIAKVYNLKTTIIHTKKPPTYVIEGRTVNQNDVYSLQYLLDSARVRKDYSLHDQDYIWLPVKSVTETHTLKAVYNFEVAHDNSYTANNAVVHNCQSFSKLSNQLGLSTATGLLVHELVRIRDIIKPTYFLFENVYMLPSHLRALNELF